MKPTGRFLLLLFILVFVGACATGQQATIPAGSTEEALTTPATHYKLMYIPTDSWKRLLPARS